MNCNREDLLLYAVTDRSFKPNVSLYEQAESALKGGVTMLQIREKDLAEEDFLKEANEIKTLCNKYHVPLIINDNVELCKRCGADGVHIGQHDMPASEARAIIGKNKILGVSAQTVAQAIEAEKSGADYLGVGAVFPTSTKSDADDVSLDVLREICEAVKIPVVAIGGISMENIHKLKGSKIAGAALVSAIFAAEDIERECVLLKEKIAEAVR